MGSGPRILLALLGALVLFAQAGHWTLTSHRYCATHAAFSHEAHDDDHAGEAPHDAVTDGDGDDDHEHCTTTVTPGELGDLAIAAPSATWIVFADSNRPPRTHTSVTRLYALAPKNSPPDAESHR